MGWKVRHTDEFNNVFIFSCDYWNTIEGLLSAGKNSGKLAVCTDKEWAKCGGEDEDINWRIIYENMHNDP